MKRLILLLGVLSLSVQAQTQSTPSGAISRSPENDSSTTNTSNSSSGTGSSVSSTTTGASLTFTNKQGQRYTVDQLANELKTLRATVEQATPMLQAFSETYSNSASGDKSLTGKLSGLLSGALNRNQNTNNAADQSSNKYGDLVTALQGLLSKNNPNAPLISANTIRDLETLYAQLQPVNSTLQNLNVNVGSSSSTGIGTNSTPGLTPTGRTTGSDQSNK